MYTISNECIACGRCYKNCVVQAIYPGDEKYEIDQDICVQCGTCAEVCPISAASEVLNSD